jgi:hypothetical protein
MRVVLKPDAVGAVNVRGWLKAQKQYLVLSVEAAGTGASRNFYRIESEDNNTPALFEADLFRLVDPRLPSCWIAVQQEGVSLQLMPASWAGDDYWERFFDGEPAARRKYEDAMRDMLTELGPATEMGS